MKYYNEKEPLYLEIKMSSVGIGVGLLQVREGNTCFLEKAPYNTALCPIAFASKCLFSAEARYSNIQREMLSILHGLETFLHCCFAYKVNMITDQKSLAVIFRKDVVQNLPRALHIRLPAMTETLQR